MILFRLTATIGENGLSEAKRPLEHEHANIGKGKEYEKAKLL